MALANPCEIADAAEAVYKEKYAAEYERLYDGKFVVIDVTDERAYLACMRRGRLERPGGSRRMASSI